MAGRAVSDRHALVAPPEGAIAMVGIDYGYMAPRGELEKSTVKVQSRSLATKRLVIGSMNGWRTGRNLDGV